MPRPPTTDEQRAAERRRIRQAAAGLNREHGIAAVTVRAVAERAGISTGKLYSYFGGLQELMRSLWAEPVAKANETFEAIAAAEPEPVERLRALLSAYVEFARSNGEVYRGAFLFVRPTALTRPEQRPTTDVPFLRLVGEAIADGQRLGRIRDGDRGQLAELLWAGLHGSIALPINADLYTIDASGQLAPDMVDLLLDGISVDRPDSGRPRPWP